MQTNQLHYNAIYYQDFENSHIPEILQEIYLQKIYFPYLTGKKDAILLDIGLNIGLWSLYASKYASTIYAFEPSKDICNIARYNMEQNDIKNVKIFQKAIGPTDGKVTFYHSTNRTMFSTNPLVNDNKEKEEVDSIRLDTLVKQEKIEHIDFAKIDIEGAESKLFTSESFKNIVPILDSFIYEFHSWDGSNPNVINHGLMEYGFKKIKQLPVQATVFACTK